MSQFRIFLDGSCMAQEESQLLDFGGSPDSEPTG